MPAHALALVLASSLMHACWNVLLAGRRQMQAASSAALLIGLVAFSPAIVLTWHFETAALPWLAASAALELVYFVVLTYAYERYELSLVYPVARGMGPVLLLAVGTGFLGVGAGVPDVVGVLLVSGGILLVRKPGKADLGGIVLAVLVGLCIMGFTLIDREGIKHMATVPFFSLALAPVAIAGLALHRRAVVRNVDWRTAAVGLCMFGGYAFYLLALKHVAPHAAQATRESSIVWTTLLAAVVLKEKVTRRRVAGVCIVLAGVITIAVG